MGIIFLWEMGNQIKKKKKVHDQEMGPSNKSKEGTKTRMSSLHWKRKKISAILNPSPIVLTILKSRSSATVQFRNTNTHATAESSPFSIYSKFWRQKWSFPLLCSGLFWVWSHYRYPQLFQSLPCTTWLLQRFILVPVFANQKTSEEDVCFYEKCLWKVQTVFHVSQGVVTEAACTLKRASGPFPGTTLSSSAPSCLGSEPREHLYFTVTYFMLHSVRCDLR